MKTPSDKALVASEKAMDLAHLFQKILEGHMGLAPQQSIAIHIDAHTEAAVQEAVAEYKRVLGEAEAAITLILNSDMAAREEDEGVVSETLSCVRQSLAAIEQLTKEKNV